MYTHTYVRVYNYMYVYRILRQIFQSLGPIIDALILFFFFVTIFALSGMYVRTYACVSHTHTHNYIHTYLSV